MPRVSDEEAYPPASKKDSNRSADVKTPVGALAQLASGMDEIAWSNRKRGRHRLDAAGRRADQWKKATEEMLKPWFAVQKNEPAFHTKCNIAE